MHKLIEEFMLITKRWLHLFTNKKKGADKKHLCVSHHDFPDPDRVSDFAVFAKQFGHTFAYRGASGVSRSLNKLMDEIEGSPAKCFAVFGRAEPAKAKYLQEQRPFGLAFEHYTHFTSPIRRYPDMMVHRLLQHYLDEGKSVNKTEYEAKCVHSSGAKSGPPMPSAPPSNYKQVEFMSLAEDKLYKGIITGVTDFGILWKSSKPNARAWCGWPI